MDKILLERIKHNDLEHLLKFKIEQYTKNIRSNGCTFLTWAIRTKASLYIISHLVTKLPDLINTKDSFGATPLLLAIYFNRSDVTKLLLSNGADINIRDPYNTALTLAVKNANLNIIELLVENDAACNDIDIDGKPPLILAIESNRLEIINVFCNWNVGLEAESLDGETPLTVAANTKSVEILELLVKDVDQEVKGKSIMTWAIENGSMEVLKILLQKGANINELNSDGNTPLSYAVESQQYEIVSFLIKNNANVCKVGMEGQSPLLQAVINRDVEMIQLLLDTEAEYIIDSVFLDAIETNCFEVVKLLTDRGALVSYEKVGNDNTPLEESLELVNPKITKYLLENGADVLRDLNNQEVDKIMGFMEENKKVMVEVLVENGARLNTFAECGHTLLTKAVELENFDMVKYFIARGCDVNQANEHGLTPLVIAVQNNDFKTFQYLVECGAKVGNKEQEQNPKLIRYYGIARENCLKRGRSNEEFGSN